MPKIPEPGCRVGISAEDVLRRERSWETAQVDHHDQGGEQITTGEDQQGGGADLGELAKQQHCGEQVADRHRGPIGRNEPGQFGACIIGVWPQEHSRQHQQTAYQHHQDSVERRRSGSR